MKKVFIIILVLCLQNGFCNNIKSNLIDECTSEIALKLSNDQDFIQLTRYSIALGITNYIAYDCIENGKTVINEEKLIKEDLISKLKISNEKVQIKFPELSYLNDKEKIDTFLEAKRLVVTSLTFAEFASCTWSELLTNIEDCFTAGTLTQKISFVVCMSLAFGGDILTLAATEFAASAAVALAIPSEIQFCANVSYGIAAATCTATILNNYRKCLQTQRND